MPGKPAAQLDSGRELAALVECGTDRRSICLGDDEHNGSMGTPIRIGKLFSGRRTAYNEMVSELQILHEGRRSVGYCARQCYPAHL